MQLLAQEEYGLRCLLDLSRHPGDAPRTIQEIAKAEGLSPDYAAKLLRELRRGGLVRSTRGASGGYRLTRGAGEITVWDAIEVLGGALIPERFCECHPGLERSCVRRTDCSLRALWHTVDSTVKELLRHVTLEDLTRNEHDMASWLTRPDARSL